MRRLEDVGLGKYRRGFQSNEIDGEMLLALEESELGELGIPSWSGDRRRLMEAIARLREQAGREDTDPPHAANDAGESEVGQWLMSAGFGRFRQLFAQFRVESLAEVSQMERDDLAEMGVPDGGGQLGRLMAAIGGLRYTFQTGSISVRGSPPNVDGSARARSVFGDVSYRSGRSRRMKEDDAESRWETETAVTGMTGVSKQTGVSGHTAKSDSTAKSRSKSRDKKKRPVMDFLFISESVEVSDVFGQRWNKMTAHLFNNKLLLFVGHKKPEPNAEPKATHILDGLIVDDSEKRVTPPRHCCSLLAAFVSSLYLGVREERPMRCSLSRASSRVFPTTYSSLSRTPRLGPLPMSCDLCHSC